jgi:hypothetical protein
MKNIFTTIALLLTISVFAQTPEGMSYQALIRNTEGKLVQNSQIRMQISILKGSEIGTAIYTETQTPTTNSNGLISINIGLGTSSDNFSDIDWANDSYFIKTETDLSASGGTNYTITGTSQLLSVPYALHAKTAGNSFSGNYNDLKDKPTTDGSATKISAGTNTTVTGTGITEDPYVINSTGSNSSFIHYIGELYQGGIIVSVWIVNGIEHGLITSLTDISTGVAWSNVASILIGITAQSPNDGQSNTNAIITQPGHTASAAKLCDEYTSDGFSDWYLPSLWELEQCFNSAFVVNNILGTTNGFKFDWYWSSTESESDSWASGVHFASGGNDTPNKVNINKVRAVSRF